MNETTTRDVKTFFGKRMQYWTAKEIAEIFECHEWELEKINSKAHEKEENELWSIRETRVTFEISENWVTKREIVVETLIFNEFDDNPRTKYRTISNRFEDRDVQSIADYSKVIEDYFHYFNDDYDCYFGVFDKRK